MDPNTNQINLRDIVWVGGIPTAPSLPTGATITVLVSEAGADGTPKTAKFINGKNVPIEIKHEDCSRVAEGASGLMMRIGSEYNQFPDGFPPRFCRFSFLPFSILVLFPSCPFPFLPRVLRWSLPIRNRPRRNSSQTTYGKHSLTSELTATVYRDRVSYLTAGTPSYYQERDTGDTRGILGTGMIDRGRILDIPGWQEWKTLYWDYGTGFFIASEELRDM